MITAASTFSIPVENNRSESMAKWRGKRIIVAPVQFKATSDFILHLLVEGCKVIGLTNNLRRSETLRSTLPHDRKVNFSSQECDWHSMVSVRVAFQRIHEEFGKIHLFIFMLPKFSKDDYEHMFAHGYEMRLQQMLDVSLDSARMCLRQAESILFPPCCEKMCNSELMWIVRYNFALVENVVEHLIKRMSSEFYTAELCDKSSSRRHSSDEQQIRYSWQLYKSSAATTRSNSLE